MRKMRRAALSPAEIADYVHTWRRQLIPLMLFGFMLYGFGFFQAWVDFSSVPNPVHDNVYYANLAIRIFGFTASALTILTHVLLVMEFRLLENRIRSGNFSEAKVVRRSVTHKVFYLALCYIMIIGLTVLLREYLVAFWPLLVLCCSIFISSISTAMSSLRVAHHADGLKPVTPAQPSVGNHGQDVKTCFAREGIRL